MSASAAPPGGGGGAGSAPPLGGGGGGVGPAAAAAAAAAPAAESEPVRKRSRKRRLVEPPEPSDDGKKVMELISVVKCTLSRAVTSVGIPHAQPVRERLLALLERVVVTVNKMRKRVSMLAKELALHKLGAGEELPTFNQSFYSALYTSLRNGQWKHGHDALLARRRVADPGLGSVMTQAMSLAGKKMAAELKTHYEMHYERFYRRWKKMKGMGKDEERKEFYLDPSKTKINVLITAAWRMLRELEDNNRRAFALFPEAKLDVSYVTLDAACVVHLFKRLFPKDDLCYRVKTDDEGGVVVDAQGQPVKLALASNDMTALNGPAIFARLFDMQHINKLRGNDFHFRFALMTDGYGVALSFGRWIEYDSRAGQAKAARTGAVKKKVQQMQPGRAYGDTNKTLDSLDDLQGYTIRAADPGVHRAYTSVDLCTEEKDVRKTVMSLRSKDFRKRTRAKEFGDQMKWWYDEELKDVQADLNTKPFRNSSYAARYSEYVDKQLEHWDAQWAFYVKRKRRKLRFRSKMIYQRELDREVNKLCKPRDGDDKTLLLYGNAASTNIFGRVKSNVKGPAKRLFDHAVRRKAAVTVWVDEFRTSKLNIYGQRLIHPRERRPHMLRPKRCKAELHGVTAQGCRCYCAKDGCAERRTVQCWCAEHQKRVLQHDVCYHNHDQHGHRMWNRDVVGALNIGCRFLANAMGLDLGLWSRNATDDRSKAKRGIRFIRTPVGWADIFESSDTILPFLIPTLVV